MKSSQQFIENSERENAWEIPLTQYLQEKQSVIYSDSTEKEESPEPCHFADPVIYCVFLKPMKTCSQSPSHSCSVIPFLG